MQPRGSPIGSSLASNRLRPASVRPEPSHPSQPLRGPNLALIHSKVMRDFMPQRLLHQTFQILAVTSEPLVRALEYRDPVGQMEGFKNATVCQRAPFIQSEKR